MSRFRVGVQAQPQHTWMADLRIAWQRADTLEVCGQRVARSL